MKELVLVDKDGIIVERATRQANLTKYVEGVTRILILDEKQHGRFFIGDSFRGGSVIASENESSERSKIEKALLKESRQKEDLEKIDFLSADQAAVADLVKQSFPDPKAQKLVLDMLAMLLYLTKRAGLNKKAA